jgi:hypothetical protein
MSSHTIDRANPTLHAQCEDEPMREATYALEVGLNGAIRSVRHTILFTNRHFIGYSCMVN